MRFMHCRRSWLSGLLVGVYGQEDTGWMGKALYCMKRASIKRAMFTETRLDESKIPNNLNRHLHVRASKSLAQISLFEVPGLMTQKFHGPHCHTAIASALQNWLFLFLTVFGEKCIHDYFYLLSFLRSSTIHSSISINAKVEISNSIRRNDQYFDT